MPGGTKLGEAKLRGVTSSGMILSAAELEIGEDSDGIMVLDDGPAPGAPLGETLPIGERVLELEVTPNRVDCFGVYGVAREVHAVTAAPLGPEPWHDDAHADGDGSVEDYASVTVKVPSLCPRFTARVFTDVEIGPSPAWLQARLTAAGQRPINNVVDITNYVMLLTAQPLHSFDLDRVPDGALTVRAATEGETMTTLDGVERTFDAETVLVCDSNGPSGIAGIMGGQVSEVSDETTRVLLEVANWNGTNILRTSRLLGLRSEASSRFEKQLHPELCMRAQRIASRLMVELCGAKLVPGTIDVAGEIPPHHHIGLREERVEGLLGMKVEEAEQIEYLERLGFTIHTAHGKLLVEVPADRHSDVTREVDLIEEIGRVHGLEEHLPSTLPDSMGQAGALTRPQKLRRRAEDAMRDLGFDEIVGWSFTDPGEAGRLRIPDGDPRAGAVVIANPLSEEQSVMRTTLLGSLLDVARGNLARGAERVALFESGRVYLPPDGGGDGPLAGAFPGRRPAPFHEPHRIGCLAVGALEPGSWRGAGTAADFFALKGVLEGLAARLGVGLEFRPAERAVPAPRPLGRGGGRRGRRGLGRRGPPARLPCLGRRRRRRFRGRPGAARRRLAGLGGGVRGPDHPPRRPPGPRRRRRGLGPRRRGARRRAGGRGRPPPLGRGLRPLPGRAARRGAQEPGPAARVPRRRPDPDRRGGGRPARLDRRQARRDRGDAP